MLTVDEYGRIRRAHRDGMSIREIARQFHHSRYKVREILRCGGEPQKYRRRETQSFPKLAPMLDRIREILKADEAWAVKNLVLRGLLACARFVPFQWEASLGDESHGGSV